VNVVVHLRRSLPHIATAAVALGFLATIMLAHVFSPAVESQLIDDFMNSLHGPGFAVVVVFILSVLRLYHRSVSNYLYAAAAAMTIGVLSEAVQIPGPRDASASDLLFDAVGILAGLGLLARFDKEVQSRLSNGLFLGLGVGSILAVIVTFVPTTLYGYAAISQYRAMPTIVSFENTWEKISYYESWRGLPELIAAPPDWPEGSGTIARTSTSRPYGTLFRVEPFADWSDYSTLNFMAASGDESRHEILLTVRELPGPGRRRGATFERKLSVGPSPQRFVVPLADLQQTTNGRPFNVSRISSVNVTAIDPGDGASVLFDDFRLE